MSSREGTQSSDRDPQGSNPENTLPERVERLHQNQKGIRTLIEQKDTRITELENQLTQQREQLTALAERIDELDSRTDLLSLVDQEDDLGPRQRSTILLQYLKREAEQKQERGEPAKAGLDRDGAEKVLHSPNLDRTAFYQDMQRAARILGDEDVAWYTDGVLHLNLEATSGDGVTIPQDGVTADAPEVDL